MTILIGLGFLVGALALMALCVWIVVKIASSMLGDRRFPLLDKVMRLFVRRR